MTTPILMLGAGRMGGAMVAGWRRAETFASKDILIRDPNAPARDDGVAVNPPEAELARARTVVLAVKPQVWRAVAAEAAPLLASDAVIVSVAAGVRTADISGAFGGRAVARVMPTTAVAINQGATSLYAASPEAADRARALFEPLGVVAEVADEELIHATTAISGSAPAYLYAFIEALEAAGANLGLPPADASSLARATITGAAALLAEGREEPAELRRQVTSPGGTTQAALDILLGDGGLPDLLRRAAQAAAQRSKELGA